MVLDIMIISNTSISSYSRTSLVSKFFSSFILPTSFSRRIFFNLSSTSYWFTLFIVSNLLHLYLAVPITKSPLARGCYRLGARRSLHFFFSCGLQRASIPAFNCFNASHLPSWEKGFSTLDPSIVDCSVLSSRMICC